MSSTTIKQIAYDKIYVPFKEEVHWSAGTRPGITRLVVRVETEGGAIGLGETICLLEFIEPVLAKTVIPLAIGEDACNIERLLKKMEGAGYYHHKRALVMALCAVEMACWDIVGKAAGMPLFRLWGGEYRDHIPLVAYLQAGDVERIAEEAASYVERGFRTVKIKLGMDEQRDIDLVRAVREAVGPKVKIRGDVNGAWSIGTAKRQLRKLAAFDLEYIEQPLPLEDLRGHAHLRQNCGVPIALDESAYTLQDVHAIVAAEAADVVLLDPHEAGGMLSARKQAAVCEAAGIPVTLHSGGELGVSLAAYLQFAATVPNLTLAMDTQYLNMSADIVRTPHQEQGGSMVPPRAPGLGVELMSSGQIGRLRTENINNPYLDPSRPTWFATKPAY